MTPELLAKYDRPVPRYTSYPTAPHFHAGIGPDDYRGWLAELPAGARLSLYLHVPFCQELCWYCGCHTTVARRYRPVAEYLGLLLAELELVGAALGERRPVSHIHFGGGTPTMLAPADLLALGKRLRQRFAVPDEAEFAVEIDPRRLTRATVAALAGIGVKRASLGVQDVNGEVQEAVNRRQPFALVERAVHLLRHAGIGVKRASLGVQDVNGEVQEAVNRRQPFALVERAVHLLRHAGISGINFDLMYGLPHQTVGRVLQSVEAALRLRPGRIALFGYAHVPWMKRHQRLIDAAALPCAAERAAQFAAAAARLGDAGYVAVGLDHFALPDDSLALALRQGRLRRNFQGYTTDTASALLGCGASAIGSLPGGYVQNAVSIPAYRAAIRAGRLATARGIALAGEDRARRSIIERLMCDFAVDLGGAAGRFAAELAALAPLADADLVSVEDGVIRIRPGARALARTVCAVFDAYLDQGSARHSHAV
jgi:oxygen-independent coproporphyrinogen-3 oxidase